VDENLYVLLYPYQRNSVKDFKEKLKKIPRRTGGVK